MINSNTTTIDVQLDITSMETGVTDISGSIADLIKILKNTGMQINDIFEKLLCNFEELSVGINALTNAVVLAVEKLQCLMSLLIEQQTEDQALSLYSAIVDTLSLIFSVGELIVKSGLGTVIVGALKAAASALGISMGALVGIIAAVVAAIAALVAVIIYWDEIVLFFTETVPKLWEQCVEWLRSAVATIGAFFVDCWNVIVNLWDGFAQWVLSTIIQPVKKLINEIAAWVTALFSNIWQTIISVSHNIATLFNYIRMVIQTAWQVVADWFDQTVVQPTMHFFASLWASITGFATNAWSAIQCIFLTVASWFDSNVIQPVAGFFADLWNGFVQTAKQAWTAVQSVFATVAGFLGDTFTEAWTNVVTVFDVAGDIFNSIVNGILDVFTDIVNGLIDGINAVIARPFNGINKALQFVSTIEVLGMKPFSDLGVIAIPQIPYLAKGAVLPANRPFLAMVGDQRHGTNIEAPLATIQEAVALVMEDQFNGMMVGLEASVDVQKQILRAVLGIEIGDTTIGQAAARYDRKMAIIKGGM